MRPSPDLLTRLVRLILRLFFRSVEVVGAERLPLGRPMVLVANHVNGLIDPLFLLGSLPVQPKPLAKNTLWKIPVVRPFVEWAGAIPVYRRQDQVDTAQNEETFIRCHELLAQGGALALFPGGRATASRRSSRSRPVWHGLSWAPSAASRVSGSVSFPSG